MTFVNRKFFFMILLRSLSVFLIFKGSSWSRSYVCWMLQLPICNQCLSPRTLWVQIPLRRGVLDTPLCDKVYQWLATGQWLVPATPDSSIDMAWRRQMEITQTSRNTCLLNNWNRHQLRIIKVKCRSTRILNTILYIFSVGTCFWLSR